MKYHRGAIASVILEVDPASVLAVLRVGHD